MGFDITQISSDFRNELEGGLYNIAVKEGTVWSLVNQMDGIPGKQDLNVLDFDPQWKFDARTVSEFTLGTGDVDLSRKTIDVVSEYFNDPLNPFTLDPTYLGGGSSLNPDLSIGTEIGQQAAAKMQERVSSRFYTGFGSGTPTNGFNGISGRTTTNTGTGAVTAANILAKLSIMHAAFANSTHATRTDAVIVLSSSNYIHYRQALRNASLNDVLQQSVQGTAGVQSAPWIDDNTISVIGDANYSGLPVMFSLQNVVFGSKVLSELEQPDLFYAKTPNIHVVRGYIYGGVEALESGNIFVNANAA